MKPSHRTMGSRRCLAAQELRLDPAAVVCPDACGECHKTSVAAWSLTHHATTFKDLPRSDEAKEITGKLGIKRIKAESDCLDRKSVV